MFGFIVIFLLWTAIEDMIRWMSRSPEEREQAKQLRANQTPPYHLVPYGVEWGGTYYRKCYCDGSVCGTTVRTR